MKMVDIPTNLSELAVKLFDIEAVKFGNLKLKSGIQSPIYFDLRVIISYPEIMIEVSELLWRAAQKCSSSYVSVCGVPYTALPLATLMAANHKIPMLIRRKEAKSYGTKKLIEGRFSAGDICLIVEDVVTSGTSVQETVEALSAEGILVKDAVVLLDREQGGKERLLQSGITLHSIISISNLMQWLLGAGRIDQSAVDEVNAFIVANRCPVLMPNLSTPDVKKTKVLSYSARADLCQNVLSKRLFEIMHAKKTNLALSADVSETNQLLKLADEIGPHICVLKTHIDELRDFSQDTVRQLKSLALKHNFLIFEDRKFADIGHTVQQQFEGGIYRISEWADIVDAHCLPGPGIIEGLKEVTRSTGCLLIAEMSSKGNLITEAYTKETVAIAESHRDFIFGFICTKRVSNDPTFVHFTPGIHLDSVGDAKGQQYLTPREVIGNRGCDVIIVGRGIVKANDPVAAAQLYRDAGYAAYLELL